MSQRSSRYLYAVLCTLFIGSILLLLSTPREANITHHNGTLQTQTAWVYLDWLGSQPLPTNQGAYEGWLRLPDADHLWIENSAEAQLEFWLDSERVYLGNRSARVDIRQWRGQHVGFQLAYTLNPDFPAAGQIALMQDGIAGIRSVLSPWNYSSDEAFNTFGFVLGHLGRITALGLLAGSLLLALSALPLSRHEWLLLGLVFGLSLGMRWISLNEKFSNDPGLYQMQYVWDNFVMMGRNWITGSFGIAGTDYPSGNIVYMALLQQIFGPAVPRLMLVHTTIGALVPVLLMLAGWALFSRAAGISAGVLSALYPPLIHFQQTLLLDSVAILLMTGVLIGLLVYTRWQSWLFLVIAGLNIGLMSVFRGSFAIVGLWAIAAIGLISISWREKFKAAVIVTGAALIPFSIPILINFSNGNYWLTPSRSDVQLFRANNRDAVGFNTHQSQSELLTKARHMTWSDALKLEIQRYPTRPLELSIRRLALFFESREHSVDRQGSYYVTGLNHSALLRALSLQEQFNFRLLSILALITILWGSFTAQRRRIWMVGAGVLAFMLSLSFLYVEGRTRIAGSIPVLLLAAYLPVLVREQRKHARFKQITFFTIFTAFLFFAAVEFSLDYLPRPKTIPVGELPAGAVGVTAKYDDEIELLGYGYYETDYQAGGYLTLELYWQVQRQPEADYTVSFRFVNAQTGQIDAIYNTRLAIQAPTIVSSAWEPGKIYIDRYLLALPESADYEAYGLYVGLYDAALQQLLPIQAATTEIQDNHMRLTGVSVHVPEPEQTTRSDPLVAWGDVLLLEAASCPIANNGTLDLDWRIQKRAERPWHLFIHAYDPDGELVGQQDGVIAEAFPLDALSGGQILHSRWDFGEIALPTKFLIGFYDVFTGERWQISQGASTDDNSWVFLCEP